jgi:hypothetical protein
MKSQALTVMAACGTMIAALLLGTAPNADASPVIATWFVYGNGSAGVASAVAGTLSADGTASGRGQITIDTPGGRTTLQIHSVSWVPVSASEDGIVDVTSAGQEDCVIVPVGVVRPGPVGHTFTSNCFDPVSYIGTYGKVIPLRDSVSREDRQT